MRGLVGKSAVVIGGGQSGSESIGSATAKRLASEGAHVLIGDIDMDAAARTATQIADAGGKAIPFEVDVRHADQVEAAMAAAARAHGGVQILDNNVFNSPAMRKERYAGVVDVDLDVWDDTVAVNLRGFMLACRSAIPYMLEAGGGSIINISSVVTLGPLPMTPAYVASKGGVNSLTLSIATTYGRKGVRCNAICPGQIVTDRLRQSPMFQSMNKVRASVIPNLRAGRPEDVAGVVAFLASDDAEYVNGQTIAVDGGMMTPGPFYASMLDESPAE